MSSNLIYGELQTFFGQAVPREKGLFAAFSGDNPNPGELFTSSGKTRTCFFLSVPTRYTGLLFEAVTLEKAETLLNNAALMFDVLIVDGSAQLANPVSGVDCGLRIRC